MVRCAWAGGCVGGWVRGRVGAWAGGCVGGWMRGRAGRSVGVCTRVCMSVLLSQRSSRDLDYPLGFEIKRMYIRCKYPPPPPIKQQQQTNEK